MWPNILNFFCIMLHHVRYRKSKKSTLQKKESVKKKNMKCYFWFSFDLLYCRMLIIEKFRILCTFKRDWHNCHWYPESVCWFYILWSFYATWTCLTGSHHTQYRIMDMAHKKKIEGATIIWFYLPRALEKLLSMPAMSESPIPSFPDDEPLEPLLGWWPWLGKTRGDYQEDIHRCTRLIQWVC